MTRNEILQWHILGFGLSGAEEDLGHSTTFLQLWKDVREKCLDCDRDEVLDALYTMPREHAALIKLEGDGTVAKIQKTWFGQTMDLPKTVPEPAILPITVMPALIEETPSLDSALAAGTAAAA